MVAAELPARLPRQLDHVAEQFLAGDVRVGLEVLAPGVPDHRQGVAERELDRVVAEHEGAAEVGFPVLEDRPEVAEHDVVGAR